MGVNAPKFVLVFSVLIALVILTACGSVNAEVDRQEDKSQVKYVSAMADPEDVAASLLKSDESKFDSDATKKHIEKIVQNQVAAYDNVSVDSITVMSLQGTDSADDYTVRCYVSINSVATASEAYSLSSDFTKELASRLDAYSGAVGELSMVWVANQLSGSGRIIYNQKNGVLEFSSEDFDDNLKVENGADS